MLPWAMHAIHIFIYSNCYEQNIAIVGVNSKLVLYYCSPLFIKEILYSSSQKLWTDLFIF